MLVPKDFDNKPTKFQQLRGVTKETLLKKVRTEIVLKSFKTLIIPTLLYESETDDYDISAEEIGGNRNASTRTTRRTRSP